ncbi:primosomal replication protein PriC [Rheinheimera baltica]|uniref:primosomal replication protein PriC n=1 Tax=Rheinheimera baltica TaxID=67576 RepID=UPI00273F8688|nr:primosomal replication protein PriC [Rheinheimera baltica]MDP5141735.1 primosomal replication protein [Rheinheimera baltica]MDP5189504.1 primosomal replication protein [Rheinheimera baltica]
MDLLGTLAHQLQQLKQQAEQIDLKQVSGKPQNWFDSTLFSCRSPQLTDYVIEAQRNLNHLQHSALAITAKQRLVQRLSEQTVALTRAFRNVDIRRKPSNKVHKAKNLVQQISVSSQQLYQQLSDTQEFERRLQDMIVLANRENAPDAIQRSLALHARLGRCRKALSDIERQILDLERRN